MGKTLVTGATGFIGSHLVDALLERGEVVRCLVRRTSNLRYLTNPGIELVYGALDDTTNWSEVLQDVDTVYHVAGLTFAKRRRDYFTVNHKGTEAILAAAIQHRDRISRFVHVSSLAAVGPGRNGRPVSEDSEPAPITPYGRSKLLAEDAVQAVGSILPSTIVRPPAVYGPRDYAIYEFFKQVSRGRSPAIGRSDKSLSLVHVRDLVEGIILAGRSDSSVGRVYFISSEQVYSWAAVSDLLARVMGRKARTIAIPRSLAFGVALAVEAVSTLAGKAPIISRDKVIDMSQSCWACDVDRAKRELGYRQRIPLEEGLRETVNWYKSEGWL